MTPTKEQIDPCLNCDSATCIREYDYPCNDRIRYLYKLQKHERKRRNSHKQGKIYSRNTGVDYNAFCAENHAKA